MRAQVSLTPTESKHLIAKAVARMNQVQQAAASGTIVLHPSSSTYFIVEEITGHKPNTTKWVSGIIVAKGACVEMGGLVASPQPPEGEDRGPGSSSYSWVIEEGQLSVGETLNSLMERMGPDDVYIKGVNALDTEGNVGVLIGNKIEGGTIGMVMGTARQKGFSVIFPVGLEKLIPLPIKEVAREARKQEYEYSMGLACGLLPVSGTSVSEVTAIEMLTGAQAIPIASGGLGGAEGSVVLIINGEKEQVWKAIEHVEACKGSTLPQVRVPTCYGCTAPHCEFPIGDKHWVS